MKDALGHGSNSRGLTVAAKASTYHKEGGGRWDIQHRTYQYKGDSRKAAINYGLKKISSEFPDHQEHYAEIRDNAASSLASGPKSAPAPVHDAMVGDRVHLGFGAKGGAGYFGKLTKLDSNTAEILHDNGKTYKGSAKNLSK